MKKVLNTDQQIQKLNFLEKLVKDEKDTGLLANLGSVLIYCGLVEFWAIQAARLVEQTILKAKLYEKRQLTFTPHEDCWFYDRRISTSRILKGLKKLLPSFKDARTGQKYDKEVKNFLTAANEFLSYRNALVHRLASPKINLEDIGRYCDKATQIYQRVVATHRAMCEALAPFRFSEKEIEFFYGMEMKPKVTMRK